MIPFFSIVIPLYNKEAYIETTLQSVFAQTFQNFEVILVNDGSTDNSMDIVAKFSAYNIQVFTQKNKGVANARNIGIAKAKAKHIALIDADDTWYPNHLAHLKILIDKYPNAGLFCTNYEICYDKHTIRKAHIKFDLKNEPEVISNFFEASITNMVAWTSAVAFSKHNFEQIGGFNEHLDTYEDIDLWIRMALKHDVVFHPEVSMQYKIYISDSLTKTENNTLRLAFLNSFKGEEKTNKSLKKLLDINRYALANRCKINREKSIFESAKKTIDRSSLNWKQSILLSAPRFVIIGLKWFQKKLIQRNIYLTAFK